MSQSDYEYGPKIIARLREKQLSFGDTDKAFARRMDVGRTLWIAHRLGGRRLGPTLAAAAVKTFPDLHDLVYAFMLAYRVRTRTGEVRKARRVRTEAVEVPTAAREEVAR